MARTPVAVGSGILLLAIAATSSHGKDWPACTARPGFQAVDLSTPLANVRTVDRTDPYETLRRMGIKTVIRYYDHPKETKACKTLLPDETRAIIENRFALAVVFQHNNDHPATFYDPERGSRDARRALELADANGQPYGTTIFFGVDGVDDAMLKARNTFVRRGGAAIPPAERNADPKPFDHYEWFRTHQDLFKGTRPDQVGYRTIQAPVKSYFDSAKREFERYNQERGLGDNGYKVGAYSSGMMCRFLLKGVVEQCWLAQSTAWPEYESFKKDGPWVMLQANPCTFWNWRFATAPKVEVDLNRIAPSAAPFAWSQLRERRGTVERSEKCVALRAKASP